MARVGKLTFVQVQEGETIDSLTKFGGQPNWAAEPEWPVSRQSGEPLTFIGQVELVDELFGETHGDVAYLFINTGEGGDDSWNPDSGEIAVVVQPGKQNLETIPRATGPTVEHAGGSSFDERLPCEFSVRMRVEEEPQDEPDGLDAPTMGGEPLWIQGPEYPYEDAKLLLQLEDNTAPFDVNFGTGYAYAFLNGDGSEGKMLWQC